MRAHDAALRARAVPPETLSPGVRERALRAERRKPAVLARDRRARRASRGASCATSTCRIGAHTWMRPAAPRCSPEPGRTSTPGVVRRVKQADAFAESLHEIPLHLVVCSNLSDLAIVDAQLDRPSIVGGASIYPFVQNVLLGLRAEGLGAALTTLLAPAEPDVKRLLAIPGRRRARRLRARRQARRSLAAAPRAQSRRAVRVRRALRRAA